MKYTCRILPILLSLFFLTCNSDDPTLIEVTADFNADETIIKEDQTVIFSDLSTGNPTSWSWTFEGGSPSSSSDQNPTVSYATAGTYQVSLTVSNGDTEDTETKTGFITVEELAQVTADFSANQTTINEGGSVSFTDISTGNPTSWSWEFEGSISGTSTDQNPTVTYSTAGIFQVSLTVSNNNSTDNEVKTEYIKVNTSLNIDGKWIYSANEPAIDQNLLNSIVEYSSTNNQGVLVDLSNNEGCFEYGDIKWKNVSSNGNSFAIDNLLKSCSSSSYQSTSLDVVDENTLVIIGQQSSGEQNKQTWIRYSCESTFDLSTYLEGTWTDIYSGGNFFGMEVEASLDTGQGYVIFSPANSFCWEVGELYWDNITPRGNCEGYVVSGLVKGCSSERRESRIIRIVDGNEFIYETPTGDYRATFSRN